MQHLPNWNKLEKKFAKKFIVLLLDYDGTLTPIAKTPQQAVISKQTKKLLLNLSTRYKLAIISGRSLKDIKKIVGLENIVYVGNHGLEIKGPRLKYAPLLPKGYKKLTSWLKNDLSAKLKAIKGARVEFKGLTLSVHYRTVKPKHLPSLKSQFNQIIQPYLLQKKIKVFCGKKVFEIRPPLNWHKGKAVLWLLKRRAFIGKEKNYLPIYIGDDTTDEDAFRALRRKGLTIFCGRSKRSEAKYYLKNTKEVHQFLNKL